MGPVLAPIITEDGTKFDEDTTGSCESENAENAVPGDAEDVLSLEQDVQKGKGRGKGRAERAEDGDTTSDIPPETLIKLAVYQCVRQVLENGMRMVGLVPLEVRG